MDTYLRMNQSLKVEFPNPPPNRKLLFYLQSVRIWYFACPTIALLLMGAHLDALLTLYKGILFLVSIVFISSQFFCGITHFGFDMEQVKYQLEAEEASKRKWGMFRTTPLALALPCILVFLLCSFPTILDIMQYLIS